MRSTVANAPEEKVSHSEYGNSLVSENFLFVEINFSKAAVRGTSRARRVSSNASVARFYFHYILFSLICFEE